MEAQLNSGEATSTKSELIERLGYAPENPWQVQGNLVYNLKCTGTYHKGKPLMCNDVAVRIDTRLPDHIDADIANTICEALNRQYWNK